ncbi:MAG TPA: N-acetylmuramic acid 6-phosphate etherase [Gaiellaceae bacterium]|nr:N-acetylmuramic acid 6-phosphate etherase [Gaiellaceae bacterium]
MTHTEPVTERRADDLADLDLLPTQRLVERINDEDARVAPAVRAAVAPLARAVDAIEERLREGGRLVYVGAGSSGRLALVDAAECGPTFGVPEGTVLALIAGGPAAAAAAQEAAEDDAGAGADDVAAAAVGPADAVVALSAGGSTPYTVGAARAARDAGALLVAVVCTEGSELGALADHEVVALVGPEVIAGSTRMKAGTAQKLVLNTLSTATMIRLGRTYGNLMVDVVASNAKLRARARRAVALASDASEEEADAALAASGGDAKVAIVSLLLGLDPDAARERLERTGGVVRAAVAR